MLSGIILSQVLAIASSLLKRKGYFNNGLVTGSSYIIIILYYSTAFVKEKFSADCNTLHGSLMT